MEPRKIKVVLHRPQSAENVGAVARALKNFGLSRLSIVAPAAWAGPPRSGGPGTAGEDVMARARRTARKAAELLDAAELHGDLRAALGAATWTCGTTSREVEGRPRLDPRALAAEVVRRSAAGEVALVFGEERRGLSDAELELCQAVCTIPTTAAYDSMNLAQAVAVVAYELRMADPRAALSAGPAEEPARHATVEALWARASALLGHAGYLNPQNPEHILADFRRLLARADPTQREVELLVAAIRALERQLRLGADRDGGTS
ncbi:RNA methyltransferase [Anaeromyxobacter oryzae]|uniref:tRNA (Cytidine/uridine-2'-O-)-methyltransferase TrmJ n=1 Tax=Anaeromyxobacter oryzae TaxID=2918170 RepID=A0ABM7WRC0_9BACT|nr:TrmH family RNA methyltransferase [Anaeromyxobacter oryzae]BDG02013.1 tRNA (cytidine/uridine-2'-O-)-methyltransferase TrmJ [Anaeromyxobacter oryzae]